MSRRWRRACLEALAIAAVAGTLGLLSQASWHPQPLPWIADEPYETLVPCPEQRRRVQGLEAVAVLSSPRVLFIDARPRAAFAAWHQAGALHLPYDFLQPTPADELQAVARHLARRAARRVVVYGDGEQPDSGSLLAEDLAAHGLRHVFYLRGGAAALRSAALAHEVKR